MRNWKGHVWTDEDIEFLKEYYPKRDWDAIKKRFPDVNKSSIYQKASRLNISTNEYFWTEEDVNILKNNYSSMFGHVKELVDLFNGKYTYNAIISKAGKLGLKTREYWNDEEVAILTSNYGKCSLDEMTLLLPSRDRHGIIAKAISLNLTNKSILESRFNDEEKEFVFKNYNSMTDKEMGEVLGRSTSAVNNYRFRNGLIKIHEKSSYNDLSEYVRRNNLDWKRIQC